MSGNHGIEQHPIASGCLEVTGSVAHHQDVAGWILSLYGPGELFSLGAEFLSGYEADQTIQVLPLPFPLERLLRGL